jgi:hypothetical protein
MALTEEKIGAINTGRGPTQDVRSGGFGLPSASALVLGLASPSTVFSGQKLTAGHCLQLAITAMGQRVMNFSWLWALESGCDVFALVQPEATEARFGIAPPATIGKHTAPPDQRIQLGSAGQARGCALHHIFVVTQVSNSGIVARRSYESGRVWP